MRGRSCNTEKQNLIFAPLYYAAGIGRKDAAELLLTRGAEVNAKDNIGRTPLDVEEQYEAARLPDGKRWMDVAKAEAMKALLHKHGAK